MFDSGDFYRGCALIERGFACFFGRSGEQACDDEEGKGGLVVSLLVEELGSGILAEYATKKETIILLKALLGMDMYQEERYEREWFEGIFVQKA